MKPLGLRPAVVAVLSLMVASRIIPVVALGNVPFFTAVSLGAIHPTDSSRCRNFLEFARVPQTIRNVWQSGHPFTVLHLYSTWECDSLLSVVPAAKLYDLKIWPTVFVHDLAWFERDMASLRQAVEKHGSDWLVGVSVGNEDLRKGTVAVDVLVKKIGEVRGLLREMGVGVAVGPQLLDPANRAVVDASDVLWTTVYPFHAGVAIEGAAVALQQSFSKIAALDPSKPIVIGETGWPTVGASFHGAIPSPQNQQTYYTQASCWLQGLQISSSWFEYEDEVWKGGSEAGFGIVVGTGGGSATGGGGSSNSWGYGGYGGYVKRAWERIGGGSVRAVKAARGVEDDPGRLRIDVSCPA
ncbi:MAG: hypothetical protein M1817_005546 [Caeruleum heppii]|nr:MAG: hypothetical protein M1817_005546 [Caeruleum heppii]